MHEDGADYVVVQLSEEFWDLGVKGYKLSNDDSHAAGIDLSASVTY